MEDGFDHGRLTAASDPLSMLRSAASERLRQRLGPEGLAKASPLQLAEMANEVLDALVAAAEVKPTLAEQRQLLRDVVDDAARRARRGGAGRPPVAAEPAADRLARPAGRERRRRTRPRPRTSASCRSRRR